MIGLISLPRQGKAYLSVYPLTEVKFALRASEVRPADELISTVFHDCLQNLLEHIGEKYYNYKVHSHKKGI